MPLLSDVPRRIVARRVAVLDEGGDHLCVVTEPLEAEADGPFTPLRLSAVDDLTAGHEATERPTPPTERAD